MHLGLDDVNAAGAAVADVAVSQQVVLANQRSDGGIQNAFRCFIAIRQQYGGRGHQVANVAYEQQAAARQGERGAVSSGVCAVGCQAAYQFATALVEARFQRALHQAQPVLISLYLVRGIDRRHRVLEVDDAGERRFEQHVGQARGVGGADWVSAVHHQLDVQAVVAQQEVRAGAADELRRVAQGRGLAIPVRPTPVRQWHGAVEKGTRGGDDLCATRGVIAFSAGLAGQGISTVVGVVETPPARIGGIQHEACIQHRHHQLRARDARHLVIYALGADVEWLRCIDQIADLAQEGCRCRAIGLLAGGRAIPVVDEQLQRVALVQQGLVLRGEARVESCEASPEGVAGHARPW